MSDLSELQYLRRQKGELEGLIAASKDTGDVVSELSLSERLDDVVAELTRLEASDANVGEIAILFDGAPVTRERAIDARFAAEALGNFQGLVTRLFAAGGEKELATRGAIRGASLVDLNIVGVATGSFGFILEEKSARQSSAFRTPVREAMQEAIELFEEFSQESEDDFLIEINDINPRVFRSVARFFSHLRKSDAFVKAELPDRQLIIDQYGIERAYRRISSSRVQIDKAVWIGSLVGLSPIKRTFDFRQDGSREILSGRFGHQVSQDYLEKIESDDGVVLGSRFRADVEIGTMRKPDGTISKSYTAIGLEELRD
ncbi:hypothetical protein P2H44_03115 [Albimonas sp. CAU 1670]|uniref:hypothetical protein n=1 Tax=Albimonas sp. CAU 1670 TaxID=3032599 RepID=UPI0023D98985|nr:hypothetical protein [Albimonas sp. CAU 1670]MDF2231535.1 hypothetical protein [Albimonas sp. CAU 1670]